MVYSEGMRVSYNGSDYNLMGQNGTIGIFNATLMVHWDCGLSSIVSSLTNGSIIIIDSPKQSAFIKELPCKVCSKMNDCGINKCWWCCCDNPTG